MTTPFKQYGTFGNCELASTDAEASKHFCNALT